MKRKYIIGLSIMFFTSLTMMASPIFTSKEKHKITKSDIKYKIGLNYNFQSNTIKADIGFFKDDSPFSLHRHGEWSEIINHNTFLSAEVNMNKNFFIGPKIGYEFNFVFFQARVNFIDYLDLKGNNSIVFRPDIGLTIFGLYSLSYGYNVSIVSNSSYQIKPHTISFVANIF